MSVHKNVVKRGLSTSYILTLNVSDLINWRVVALLTLKHLIKERKVPVFWKKTRLNILEFF